MDNVESGWGKVLGYGVAAFVAAIMIFVALFSSQSAEAVIVTLWLVAAVACLPLTFFLVLYVLFH